MQLNFQRPTFQANHHQICINRPKSSALRRRRQTESLPSVRTAPACEPRVGSERASKNGLEEEIQGLLVTVGPEGAE